MTDRSEREIAEIYLSALDLEEIAELAFQEGQSIAGMHYLKKSLEIFQSISKESDARRVQHLIDWQNRFVR